MFTSGYKMMLTVALILAVGVGASGAARADSFGKFLLGAAVGVLAYKALEDDHDRDYYRGYGPPPCPPVVVRAQQPWDRNPNRRYDPPPNRGPYAPSPRQAYNQGYNDGWQDGKEYGQQRGFAKGYRYGNDNGRDRGRYAGNCY